MSEQIYQSALARVRKIGESAGVNAEVIKSLMHPMRTITALLPVRMDDATQSNILPLIAVAITMHQAQLKAVFVFTLRSINLKYKH